MSTGNPAPGVGGTAKDGGLAQAPTVADGGPNAAEADGQYLPPGGKSREADSVKTQAGPNNPAPGVGGTAKDGGLSTAATVSDGGPDDSKEDPTYDPKKDPQTKFE